MEIIDGDKEILEGLWVLKTPGHTPGGQSVLIETKKGKACLAGLCTIHENFYPPEELKKMGVKAITPGIHTNAMQAYDSLIKRLNASDHVIALHDIAYRPRERIPY